MSRCALADKCKTWRRQREGKDGEIPHQTSLANTELHRGALDLKWFLNDPSRFRLIRPGSDVAFSRYATLSYCWGNVEVIKLVKSRLTEFENGLDASVLPLTFRHAFDVCRALQIRYIWIDSLCIIQDDPDDWTMEAGKMSDIYLNSFVSIAADASSNSEGGLFRPVALHDRLPIRRRLSKATYELFDDKMYDFIDKNKLRACLEEEPLNSRAWVCQERILSDRILHFTSQGLFWQCPTLYATEACQQGVPEVAKAG